MRNMVRCLQNIIISALIIHGVLRAQESQANQTPPTPPATSEMVPTTPPPTEPVPTPTEGTSQPPVETPPAPAQEEVIATVISSEAPPIQPAEPVIQKPLGPDEIQGIDTVDITEEEAQGNWLYKRVWWERAEKKFENIRKAINDIFEKRTGFFAQRAELDKNVLDPFYIKIGLSQGGLQEALTELIGRMSKGTTNEQENEIIEQAEDQKSELEQLQKEVQQVVKQDGEVDEAIGMLVDQLNKMRRLEQEAWQNFKNIARVLDDRKARELFYKVDNAWRNIQEMQGYIEKTFTPSFATLVDRIKERIQKIDNAILALKEKGIDLKKRITTEEEMEEDQEAPKGFFTRYIVDPVKNFFNKAWEVIRWPYDKLMGKKAPQEEDDQEEVLEEVIEAEEKEEVPTAPTKAPEEQPVIEEVVEEETEASDPTDTQEYKD